MIRGGIQKQEAATKARTKRVPACRPDLGGRAAGPVREQRERAASLVGGTGRRRRMEAAGLHHVRG